LEEGNDFRKRAQVFPFLLSKGREQIFHLDLSLPSDHMHSREDHPKVEADQNESKDREEQHCRECDGREEGIFRKERELLQESDREVAGHSDLHKDPLEVGPEEEE